MLTLALPARSRTMATLRYLVLSMRPKQWTKNLLVFLAAIFAVKFTDMEAVTSALLAFVTFCLLTGATYLLNDLVDVEGDRQHPQKRLRPLASGRLKRWQAVVAVVLLLAIALPLSFRIHFWLGVIAASYFVLMVAYSLELKHMVIIDVLTIALGFVLRAVAGAVAIAVPISPWLYICTLLGALFLGFAKRRQEIVLLNENASQHRHILTEYSPKLLDEMISVVTPALLVTYGFYTFSAENLPSNHAMMLTIPFVIYGIFRYLYLVHHKELGGSPEEVLLSDMPLMIDVVLWLGTAAAIIALSPR